MSALYKLTTADGRTVLVAPGQVQAIEQSTDGATRLLVGISEWYEVKGTPEEVAARLGIRVLDRTDAQLAYPIGDMEWSVRSRNVFRNEGINTVGDLCAYTPDEVREWRNFGRVCLAEVRLRLAERGLRLRGDAWEPKS